MLCDSIYYMTYYWAVCFNTLKSTNAWIAIAWAMSMCSQKQSRCFGKSFGCYIKQFRFFSHQTKSKRSPLCVASGIGAE